MTLRLLLDINWKINRYGKPFVRRKSGGGKVELSRKSASPTGSVRLTDLLTNFRLAILQQLRHWSGGGVAVRSV